MYLIKGLFMFFSKSNTRDDTDEPNKEYKKPQTSRLRLWLFTLKLFSFYLVSTFAFLQMYMASTAATASTASEIIVNIIIVTLS